MTIQDLIKILQNRLLFNEKQKEYAEQRGDIEAVSFYEKEIATTQETLKVLIDSENKPQG